jgi:hydroxymethylbilane synthase
MNGCTLFRRDNPQDVVVLRKNLSKISSLDELATGSILGTSSPRRIAQLMRHYPHLQFKDIVRHIPFSLSYYYVHMY